MSALVIRRPDDWHLHLRDGAALAAVLPFTAARFARAIIMPNLSPPVTTAAAALAYRERIRAALPAGAQFEPLMTLYLTDQTPVEEIARARAAGVIGCKFYPAGATTHSAAGVTDVRRLDAVFERMAEAGLVLQVHGEVTDPAVDVFERRNASSIRCSRPSARAMRGCASCSSTSLRARRSSSCRVLVPASPPRSRRSICS